MAEYKKGGYKISDIYQGGYSSLNPSNSYITTGSLGMTTDPRVANVLQEVSTKLSTGVKQIEITAVSPEVFDSMPKQQLKEVNRLAKLTGIDVSLHGPVINISGINQQGFSESEREAAERRVTDTLLRAKELNPEGNIPVTFHSSEGIPGSQLLPPSKRKEKEEYQRIIAVNRESGKLAALEPEIKYYPGEKIEEKNFTPEKRIKILNDSEWDNSLNQVFFNQERAKEILGKNQVQIQHILKELNQMQETQGKIDPRVFSPEQIQAYNNLTTAQNYLQDVRQQVNDFFSKAYEFGDERQKEILKAYSEDFRKKIEGKNINPFAQAEALQELINQMRSQKLNVTPNMWVPIEEFSIGKSAQTFGNAAFESYKKFGEQAPLLVIENPPAGFALSTGEDIKNVVEASRKQFIEQAKKEGISESQAKKEAEKLIGATWDVGHINMLRKHGYSEEEIVGETKKIAPYVKHIHLSDNFGFEHTELPMGMGNVPLKKMMEKLGEKGVESKKIIEAAHWWQHFKTPPFQEVLEGVGSPVYSMKMAPYWNQTTGLQEGYFSGYGQTLPQINYETFGAGFSQLPQELGGQMPGARGNRMSGRPME
ncbi:MAG TPA: hypothetical protein VMV95_01585 [Bacillota bacterium]|nr:hypothetical protein [Bacillota bacterium]